MIISRGVLLSLLMVGSCALCAQSDSSSTASPIITDTLDWRYDHSPRKASIYSAVLPGAGQVYNRKYWKVPIVLGGLGVSYYFIQENNSQYRRYKDAYIALTDSDPSTVDEFNGRYSSQTVLNVSDTYRKWRDLSYIAIGAVYILNIVDASVDAHFVRFDVGRDLSMQVAPSLSTAAQGAPGLSVSLVLR